MKAHHIITIGCALACSSLPSAADAPSAPPPAAAAPTAKPGIPIPKPAELMKLTQVQPGLYALRCAGVDKAAANSYGPYLAGAPVPEKPCAVPRFGCSSVVNGDFVGRNMDYFMTPAPFFLVWTDAGADHHASLAVAMAPLDRDNFIASSQKNKDDINAYSSPEQMARAAALLLDGVNEKGVCCTTHVVNPMDANNTAKGTNPGAQDLSIFMVCRYILDHASTADEAIELLKQRNIRVIDPMLVFHWIVADANHSYIVEVAGDRLRYTDKKKVMTNYLATIEGIHAHPYGLERARILEEHYGEGTSVEGMYNLMRRVQYTQAYRLSTKPYWYSDHFGLGDEEHDITIQTPVYDPDLQDEMKKKDVLVKEATPENNPHMLWETTYSTVYDMRNKTVRIMRHENYDTYYDAKL